MIRPTFSVKEIELANGVAIDIRSAGEIKKARDKPCKLNFRSETAIPQFFIRQERFSTVIKNAIHDAPP
jgi:hypothetical protein